MLDKRSQELVREIIAMEEGNEYLGSKLGELANSLNIARHAQWMSATKILTTKGLSVAERKLLFLDLLKDEKIATRTSE